MNTVIKIAWDALFAGNFLKCREICERELEKGGDGVELDEIRWPMGYAFIELKMYDEAFELWDEIYTRTGDHKALHQTGLVERERGRLVEALSIFRRESDLLPPGNKLAKAVNLYELSFCSMKLDNQNDAIRFFEEYQTIEMSDEDPIERGCFYRLKGDLNAKEFPKISLEAYLESRRYFALAADAIALAEIDGKIKDVEHHLLSK